MLHVISMYNVLFSNIHGLDLDCGRRRAKTSCGQKSGWTSRRPLQFFFFRQIFLPSPSHCALIGFSLVGEITNCPPVTKWCNCLVIQTTASQVEIGGGAVFALNSAQAVLYFRLCQQYLEPDMLLKI